MTRRRPPARGVARDRLRLLAGAVVAIGAAGCGIVPPLGLQAPRIDVASLSIRGIGRDEIRFALVLDAHNPNALDVPLTNLRFDLELLERPFASGGATERTVTLPANATRAVPIEFGVATARLIELLREFRVADGPRLSYRLRGSANWADSPFTIPFERRGEFEALQRLRELMRALTRP